MMIGTLLCHLPTLTTEEPFYLDLEWLLLLLLVLEQKP